MNVKRGDIFMAELNEHLNGSMQKGLVKHSSIQKNCRPVIICSNDLNNRHSTVVTVVPLTGRRKKFLPTHVYIEGCGLPRKSSIALCEQILSLDKFNLQKKLGTIRNTAYEGMLKKAIEIQLGL